MCNLRLKGTLTGLVVSLLLSASAVQADDMMGGMQGADMPAADMQSMDQNHDGMVSKAEFMKYHENMWVQMEKNDHGMYVLPPHAMQPPSPGMGKGMGKGMGGMGDM